MDNYQRRCIRRTLSKRIRKTISLCILISIMLFGVIVGHVAKGFLKTGFSLFANYFGNSIAQKINSSEFLTEMGISGLEELDVNSEKAQRWLLELDKMENTSVIDFFSDDLFMGMKEPGMVIMEEHNHTPWENTPGDEQKTIQMTGVAVSGKEMNTAVSWNFNLKNLLTTTIAFNGNTVYPLPQREAAGNTEMLFSAGELPPSLKKLLMYYDISYQYDLYSSPKEAIGSLSVAINPDFIIVLYVMGMFFLVLFGLAALLVTNLISKPLASRIIKPIQQMERAFRQAADGDYSCCNETPIHIRRPLREIQSMVQSTNIIINNLKRYNDQQEQQKVLLQQQNIELEAQNQELADSKEQIEQAQSQLIQMENMAQVGQLTAAISHEINTPLGVINSNVQLSEMLVASLEQLTAEAGNSELQDVVAQISEASKTSAAACKRIDEIIKNLKVFSKIDQSDFQEADINAGIRSTVVLTTNLWKKNIHIVEEYGELPRVKCYAGLLNQVFMNIMVNAIESIEKKGEIHIKTWYEENKVRISIQDNGKGIPAENLNRIFDFGFSTKGEKGMGIGLAMCDDIMRKHRGEILVVSEPGKGTAFTLTLPVAP